MTIPAVFGKLNTPSKQLKQNTHFNGESESLTPTKSKLIQNSNTQTMLRMFQQDAGKPPGLEMEV